MPYSQAFWSHSFPYAIALGFVLMALRRNLRPQKLSLWRMCISPALLAFAVCATMAYQPPPADPITILALLSVLALGGLVGWQRGRMTRLTIHPVTGEITAEMSMWGAAILVLILGVRYLARDLAFLNAGSLGLDPLEIADGFLLFALGMVVMRPVELLYRAYKLKESLRAPTALDGPAALDPLSGAPLGGGQGPLVADTIVSRPGRPRTSDQIVS